MRTCSSIRPAERRSLAMRNLDGGPLKLEGKAETTDAATLLFAFDLTYAGVFRIQNVPQEQVHPVVMIECPRLLFPFAREIIASAVRAGGFPPLLLDPATHIFYGVASTGGDVNCVTISNEHGCGTLFKLTP